MGSSNVPSSSNPPWDNDPRQPGDDDCLWFWDDTHQNVKCSGQHNWDRAKNEGTCEHFLMGRCFRGPECRFIHPRFATNTDGERFIYGAWYTNAHRFVCRQMDDGQNFTVYTSRYHVGYATTCLPAPTFGDGDWALGFALQAAWQDVFHRAADAREKYLLWLHDGLERIEATRCINPQFFSDAVTRYLAASEQLPPFPRFRTDSPDALRAFKTIEKAFNSEYAYMRGVLREWSTSPVEREYRGRKFRNPSEWLQNVYQQVRDTLIPRTPITISMPGPSHPPTPPPTPEEPSSIHPARVDRETQACQEELPPFHPSKIGPPKEVLPEESSPADVKGKGKEKEVSSGESRPECHPKREGKEEEEE